MCYASGSIDQAVNVCPMCKVFPHARCPHVRDVCRNRAKHPRFDVLFLKNAEVDWFNGCGYCKWARISPPPKSAGYHNIGWPGCCRAPTANEYRFINLADWKSVSIIHHIPVPPEIKTALDSLSINSMSTGLATARSSTVKSSLDRKNSVSGSPPGKSTPNIPPKTAVMSVPGKGSSSNPRQESPTATMSRSQIASSMSSSVPTASSLELHIQRRQAATEEAADRHSQSAHSSPNRKHIELESSNASSVRRDSTRRLSTANPSSTSRSGAERRLNLNQSPERRRLPATASTTKLSPPSSRASDDMFSVPTSEKDGDSLSSASSSSGSDSLGSLTDSTVTSDGGFTDYLSDESEAELQRQAEAKAALLAQNQAEELEFKAARQQLAHVDLRPPKTWNPANITNSTLPRISITSQQCSSGSGF